MLREYIETRYKMNKAMREELEKQIRTLQEEHQAAEEALKELQKDQDIEKSIFSPRSQLGGTPEKLAEIRTKLTETEKKLGAADIKCQAVRKEETEMEQLLDEVIRLQHATDEQATIPKEASVETINVNTDIEKETEVDEELKQSKEEKNESEMTEQSDETETETEDRSEIKKISEINTEATGSIVTQPDEAVADAKSDLSEIENNAAVETVTPEKKEMEMEKEKEIQEQTLDMERLNDLLSDVYRKAEFCTAFLYSDKNKCRNLLKEMKKELKKYAEEIAGM